MSISLQIAALKQRVDHAVLLFSSGTPVLIGDDGKRENEVDFVFHASFATKENVNLAITHAKGLLCVALDHSTADRLGFYTAPRFPGGISHTNFTLTVDAKHNITSGISAQDRANTIKLMASPQAQATDFITPGHVFPLRAVEGGISSRAGHTEALYELCHLSNLPCVGAMCEVLGESGEPISPHFIHEHSAFAKLPFITTIDLLWYKVLFKKQKSNSLFKMLNQDENKYIFCNNKDQFASLPCAIQFHSQKFSPQNVRIVLNNGFSSVDNAVEIKNCCVEIILFSFDNMQEELPQKLSEFCNLSAKIGLKNTKISVKRLVTLFHAINFMTQKVEANLTAEDIYKIKFPVESDRDILCAVHF